MGAVGGHLPLGLVGQPRQGRRQIEDGVRQSDLQQEAHVTQTQGQHGQRGPERSERGDVSVQVPTDGRRGPPLSPVAAG